LNLVNALQSIERMEQRFLRDEYFQIYAETFNIPYHKFTHATHGSQLIEEIGRVYREMQPHSPSFVSIRAIADVIGVRGIKKYGIIVERPDVEQTLDQAKMTHPKDFHFHVDNSGRRSFLSISQNFLTIINT